MDAHASPAPLPYRQQQAQATRQRIVQAARRLFAERGYAKTTFEMVAQAAGVAVRTVYAAVGSKQGLLAAVCEAWLVESEVQPLVGRALGESDPRRKLALAARWTRQQYERGEDVIAIFEGAARDDPAAARLVQGWLGEKNVVMAHVVRSLEPDLAPELDVPAATSLFLALTLVEVYRQLVLAGGWSAERYEAWLACVLQQQLLEVCAGAAPLRG